VDTHLPYLTVRETIRFAAALANVEPSLMGNELLITSAEQRVERVIRLLHLESCADTLARARLALSLVPISRCSSKSSW
jgi:ABC-type multidrug transport system ATPase subunit